MIVMIVTNARNVAENSVTNSVVNAANNAMNAVINANNANMKTDIATNTRNNATANQADETIVKVVKTAIIATKIVNLIAINKDTKSLRKNQRKKRL